MCRTLVAVRQSVQEVRRTSLEEQVAAAITDPERAWLLDPLIQVAVKRRNSARSDVETHRVVDHGKVNRTPTLLGSRESAGQCVIGIDRPCPIPRVPWNRLAVPGNLPNLHCERKGGSGPEDDYAHAVTGPTP